MLVWIAKNPLYAWQVVIFVLAAWLVILGILGMAPIPEIPINDKVLHFFGVRPIQLHIGSVGSLTQMAFPSDGYSDLPALLRDRSPRVSSLVGFEGNRS